MQHRSYDFLVDDHIETLRQEADARRLAAAVARASGRTSALRSGWRFVAGRWTLVRAGAARVASAVRRAPVDVTRPRRDLGAS